MRSGDNFLDFHPWEYGTQEQGKFFVAVFTVKDNQEYFTSVLTNSGSPELKYREHHKIVALFQFNTVLPP